MRLDKIRSLIKRRKKGAAIVEFAIVGAMFLLLLLGIVEFGILFWVDLTMQHAVREGGRYAITGQSNLDPNQSSPQRYRAIIQEMRIASVGIFDSVASSMTITVTDSSGIPTTTTYSDPSTYTAGMFGGPGDVVALQLNCVWPVMTPLNGLSLMLGTRPYMSGVGQYTFSVAATMRNEYYQ